MLSIGDNFYKFPYKLSLIPSCNVPIFIYFYTPPNEQHNFKDV